MSCGPTASGAPPPAAEPLALVVDDYALAAVPGLDRELACAGVLVMRSFRGLPNPHLLRRYRGAAVIGGEDRTGLLSRLERATASVAAPVIAVLPRGVEPTPDLRGPGVVDLIPATASGVARRILLMASVPVVTAPRFVSPAAPGAAMREREREPSCRTERPEACAGRGGEVVAIASSTGGVWVLAAILRDLPAAGRAVVLAQHMEGEFVPFFADWLSAASGWRTIVVSGSVPLSDGAAYLPAGGLDLVVDRSAARATTASSRFVPCADRLLASAAAVGPRATGLVLSGMGSDGAEGLAAIARAGGRALCQAPRTAVVASMPEAALRRAPGAVPVSPDALAAAIAAPRPDHETEGGAGS